MAGRKRTNAGLICSEDNCNNPVKSRGWCKYHYQKFYKSSPHYNPATGDKRKHPLYIMWFERKQNGYLCEEWARDFWEFVKCVGEKPKGRYLLVRLRDEPYGPDNFQWQQHLTRQEGESRKEYLARQWKAQITRNPSMDRARDFKRKYGITLDQYNEMLKAQNFVCAICEQPETSFEGKSGTQKKLAIDHCHNTNKIRALLCWRCNGTIGKVEENIDLLNSMILYLIKHK